MSTPDGEVPERRYGRTTRNRAIRRVLLITLGANVAVVIAKATVGWQAGTLSVLAEAAHSCVDALNNILALALAGIAARGPDELHPYGHAKFETLGALAVVAFLSITGFELVTSAVGRLVSGEARPDATPLVFAVVTVSMLTSLVVSLYEERRGRELGSDLLIADALHTRADVYASGAVLVGLGLVALGYPRADAAVTLLVAAVIALTGWRILQTTVPVLVDERAVEARTIRRIALETAGVRDSRDERSRGRRGEVFAELTVTVAADLDVESSHRIADLVEQRIAEAVDARDVVVHVEPDVDQVQE